MPQEILVEVSARHTHLSQDALETLFGKGYQLNKLRQLSQADDFAAKETLDLKVGSRIIKGVRVIGPVREQAQIEISYSDAINLGVTPPLRISGDLDGSLGATLIGPQGSFDLSQGLIIAQRHLHCSDQEAEKIGLSNNTIVAVEVKGARRLIFYQVVVRVSPDYKLALHLDTDEGNAAGITAQGKGYLIRINN